MDFSTECVPCHPSCESCDSVTEYSCKACKLGFFKRGTAFGNYKCEECPVDRFGTNCTGTCHCLDNTNCDKTNGDCSLKLCERGYRGISTIPACQEICSPGTFGLNCQFECQCLDSNTCNHINGDCDSNECPEEYDGAGCQFRLPKMTSPPHVVGVACNKITLQWDAFNETSDIGQGPIARYDVYVRLDNSTGRVTSWTGPVKQILADGRLTYTENITSGMQPDLEYNFRVDAIGLVSGKNRTKYVEGVASEESILNYCTLTTKPPTTPFLFSRDMFERPIQLA